MIEPELILLALAGVAAGVINTIAGGGSFLTLPLLIGLGLGPGAANATLRVGILLQNVVAALTFRQRGVTAPRVVLSLALPIAAGGLTGAWLVTRLSDEVLRPLFGALLVVWAVVLLVRPRSFGRSQDLAVEIGARQHLLAFLVGIYGGFLQAGVGFPLMALLVLGCGLSPVRANSVKVTLVLIFTVGAVVIFILDGRIVWREALILGAGTMTGGWIGTRWQLKSGAGLVRWFLLVMMTLSGFLMIFR